MLGKQAGLSIQRLGLGLVLALVAAKEPRKGRTAATARLCSAVVHCTRFAGRCGTAGVAHTRAIAAAWSCKVGLFLKEGEGKHRTRC